MDKTQAFSSWLKATDIGEKLGPPDVVVWAAIFP